MYLSVTEGQHTSYDGPHISYRISLVPMLKTPKMFLCMALLLFRQLQIHQWLLSPICQEVEDEDTLIIMLKTQENNFPSNKTRIMMLLSMTVNCSQETNQNFTLLYFLWPGKWLTGFRFFIIYLAAWYKVNENRSWIVTTSLKTRQLKNVGSAHEDEHCI